MPRSSRYLQLERELSELRKHLLPRKFSATGDYPARILSRAVGYRVLAHAEIESYIEDRALEVARTALSRWKRDSQIGVTAICLMAFAGKNMDEPPPSLTPDQPSQAKIWKTRIYFSEKLNDAARAFHSVVEANHGIKENNLLKLLLPVGVNPDDLDAVWIATMNSFGEQRGEAAHKSRSTIKTTQPADPETEFNTIKRILEGLRQLDELLNSLA